MNQRLICIALLVIPITIANAGDTDWPQWRGPNRDGHAAPQELLESWPDGGPDLIWSSSESGRGYSTVAVVDGRLYTLGSEAGECFALCIDATNGSVIWKKAFSRASNPDDYNHGWGGGPRSTPTVQGDQLFVLSDVGVLAALEKSSGDVQWKIDLVADHKGKIPDWGYSDSPLVDDQRVVVTPGESNFMIAVDRHSGEKVWGSQGIEAPAQYVSIMKGNVGATSFYVTASKQGLVAFDTRTGQELFSDVTTGNTTAVTPTPILHGDKLYHTSAYSAGNTLLQLSSAGQGRVTAKSIYHLNAKTMQNHHGGVVLVDAAIYGFSKVNRGVWMAQDFESGKTLWEERINPNRSGSICFADGHLYCYNDKDGTVYLVQASRNGWNVKGKLTLPSQSTLERGKGAIWAHPVIADAALIIRDQELIYAYDIGE